MIISTNRNPYFDEFKELVDIVTSKPNNDAAKRTSYYLKRNAQLLEDDVFTFLDKTAKGTKFEGTIEKYPISVFLILSRKNIMALK